MRIAECGAAAIRSRCVVRLACWCFLTTCIPAAWGQGVYGDRAIQDSTLPPHWTDAAPMVQDGSPIYLDTCPEFCLCDEVGSPAYLEGESPAFLQPAAPAPQPALPPGVRNGMFQKLFFTGTYLPRWEDDSLGFSELETGVVLGVPFFRVTAPLLITPRFAVRYLDGPNSPDLPARLHEADVTFRHLRQFGNGPWAMNAAVTLGHYSDYQSSDSDAFRVTGQAFAVYESSPAAKWIAGVVYLNRDDLKVVPAVGLIYEPSPDIKYEAILPRPRVAWRLPGAPYGSNRERWAYVAGEFGGGIWSIQQPSTGAQDTLSYSDFRILVGLERQNFGGIGHRIEAGYVLGRDIELASAGVETSLDDSLFVRGGLTY